MKNYKITTTKNFDRRYVKIVKKNIKVKVKLDKTIQGLSKNPFQNALRTHKVNTCEYGCKYSSRVTKDLRVIWDIINNERMIL